MGLTTELDCSANVSGAPSNAPMKKDQVKNRLIMFTTIPSCVFVAAKAGVPEAL